MTSPITKVPVGRLVTERLGRSRIFDRLGIDYCCGGRKTLDRACREKGLDVDEVLREIDACDGEPNPDDRVDWASEPMGALIDHIVGTHHASLRRELPRLDAHAEKVARVHGDRHPELIELREVFAGLREELELHMQKEEKVLFPMIKRLEAAEDLPSFHCGSITNPILVMEHEHETVGSALERLRALTGGYTPPDDACTTYRALLDGLADLEADLHRHVHKENNILFPRAGAVEAGLLSLAGRQGGV
jgi:regulator of cell morphogenesis and NO signaling